MAGWFDENSCFDQTSLFLCYFFLFCLQTKLIQRYKYLQNLSLTVNPNMLPRKGLNFSKVGELSMFDDKDPITYLEVLLPNLSGTFRWLH